MHSVLAGQPKDRAKTADAGFAGHLTKPVSLSQLRAVMEQLLERGLDATPTHTEQPKIE